MCAFRTSPRLAAALGAITYALALVVLPALHLANHRDDHVHGPITSAKVDLSSVRDAKTGRVDLDKLAVALGLKDGEKRPHSHDHSQGGERHHGLGSAEHFSLAFLDTADVPVVPFVAVSVSEPPLLDEPAAPHSRLLFLDAQRAQAPPA